MSISKQIIVAVRGHMPEGKLASQVAHAAVANVLNLTDTVIIKDGMIYRTISYPVDSPESDWIDNSFTKVLLGVDTEAEMLAIYEKAKLAGLNVSLIEDEGRTVFNGVPTITTIGIGPHAREAFTGLTDHLKRY